MHSRAMVARAEGIAPVGRRRIPEGAYLAGLSTGDGEHTVNALDPRPH